MNSGPHAFGASFLSAESSPQVKIFSFWNILHLLIPGNQVPKEKISRFNYQRKSGNIISCHFQSSNFVLFGGREREAAVVANEIFILRLVLLRGGRQSTPPGGMGIPCRQPPPWRLVPNNNVIIYYYIYCCCLVFLFYWLLLLLLLRGEGEIAQQWKALAALTEDLCSVNSWLWAQFRVSDTLFWPPKALHLWGTHTYMDTCHTYMQDRQLFIHIA